MSGPDVTNHSPTVPDAADVAGSAASAPDDADAADDLVWHRVHPVTPAVKGWKILVVLLFIAAQQVGNNVRSAQGLLEAVGWGPIAGVLGLIVLIGFGYTALAWRMTRYAIDREAVYLRTGVLFRQHRTARLDRIQAIDVVQPLLARIIGLAELRIEVAGGSDSAVRLSFLKENAAQELRNELLARAAGVDFGTEEQPQAPVAPEREVLAVTPPVLVGSLLRSVGTILLVVIAVGLAVLVISTGQPGALFAFVPALLGVGGYLWQRFSGEFNFRAAQSPDGIRLRHGLLESRAQTVPPGRVQAVRLSQPLLWRRKDWWRVEMNVAGYGMSTEQQTESVLLPVGGRDEALLVLWLVLPDLGADDPRALLEAGMTGAAPDEGFVVSPRRARWLDPVSWRRNGYALTDRALLVRTRRLVRTLVVVPHERTQSIGLTQGPWQRRLRLASVALHSTPGPVTPVVPHLDAEVAGDLMLEQADRARKARAAAGPEQWMRELGARADAAPAPQAHPAPAPQADPAPAPQADPAPTPQPDGATPPREPR